MELEMERGFTAATVLLRTETSFSEIPQHEMQNEIFIMKKKF